MKTAAATLIILAAVSLGAAQTQTTRVTFPINISQSACPNLPGNLNGTVQGIVVTTMTIDGNGTAHLSETDAFHGTATADGSQYVIAHNDTFQ